MLKAKLTSKGQLTIPKKVREKLGLSPGEELAFEEKNGVFYIKKSSKPSPFDRWIGRLKTGRAGKTDKIMEELRGK